MNICCELTDASTNGEYLVNVSVIDADGDARTQRVVRVESLEDLDAFESEVEAAFGAEAAGNVRCQIDKAAKERQAPRSPKPGNLKVLASAFTDPIPLDSPRPPKLPDGIFCYWLGDMIEATAAATEVPPELPASFALATIATVLQKKFSLMIRPGYFEPLNIWVMCGMTSGNRKSENMRRATAPLSEWEEAQGAELLPVIERVTSERKTIEARIAKLRSEAAKAKADDFQKLKDEITALEAAVPEVPRVPRLFTQDVTPEHTGTMLADNAERLAILSDEAGIIDIMAGRYSDGIANLDVYLQAHAGAPVRVDRGSRPAVNLKHPALTIGISPQPDVLRGLTSKRALRGRGLLARFLYMLPASQLGWRTNHAEPVTDDVVNAYRDGIFQLAKVAPDTKNDREVPHVLRLSREALFAWDGFWAEVEALMRPGNRLEHLNDWGGKLPGHVARVAALLHCADYASCPTSVLEINQDTMERAVTFGRYLIEHALIAFDLMGADAAMEAARDLWKSIEKSRKTIFSLRDAWHPIRGKYCKVGDAEPGFDVLIDHCYIVEPHQGEDESQRRRGRPPSRRFAVNPKLTEGWQ
jgi:hypothetical protein